MRCRKPWFALLFVSLLLLSAAAHAQTSDFTVIALPDTQFYSQDHPSIFNSQTKWIAAHKSDMNIQLVLGLGDIVNDGSSSSQFQTADAAVKVLDNGQVPYLLAIGNHDYDSNAPKYRKTSHFNTYFGPARYANKIYYRGNLNGSNENFYGIVTLGGQQFVVVMLEFIPRQSALDWAASLLNANLDKPAIIVTHGYMYGDNTRLNKCDNADAQQYSLVNDNDGDETWNKLAGRFENVSLVLSGHVTAGGGSGRRADLGINNNLVNQILSDYQAWTNGGNGYLRIMKFRPSLNRIEVQTYSPYLNKYLTDSKNNFNVYYKNPGIGAGGIGWYDGKVRTSGCSAISSAKVSNGSVSATTDSSGHYKLQTPAPDNFSISVSKSGYATQTIPSPVYDGYTTSLDVFLTTGTSTPPPPPPSGGSCTASGANRTISVCSPASGGTVGSPVQFSASVADTYTVRYMQIYVDDVKVYTVNA